MSGRSSRFRNVPSAGFADESRARRTAALVLAASVAGIVAGAPSKARAQACCAGTGAVTPGRLGTMDDALVGLQFRAGAVTGSFDARGQPLASPPGAAEIDLEQDAFGALRLLEKGQVAVLVPLVETWRRSLGPPSAGGGRGYLGEAGGGLGDINANVRYDFLLAGDSRVVPGIAVLGGVTFPTGTPADAPGLGPLATHGATGVGAYQINLGPGGRADLRSVARQRDGARGAADVAHGGVGPGGGERDAGTAVDGPRGRGLHVRRRRGARPEPLGGARRATPASTAATRPGTGHRLFSVAVSGLLPLAAHYHLQGSLSANPPILALSENQPADVTLSIAAVRTWN